MTRSVVGELKTEPEYVLKRLREQAEKHHIKFEGDETRGWAEGKGFKAEYLVEGTQCTLTVTKKPLLVPWSVVEKAISKLFD